MQIEQLLVDPYLYRQGGDISGDYKFQSGTSIKLAPATSPSLHSCSCIARSAPWHATRVAEQAVS